MKVLYLVIIILADYYNLIVYDSLDMTYKIHYLNTYNSLDNNPKKSS